MTFAKAIYVLGVLSSLSGTRALSQDPTKLNQHGNCMCFPNAQQSVDIDVTPLGSERLVIYLYKQPGTDPSDAILFIPDKDIQKLIPDLPIDPQDTINTLASDASLINILNNNLNKIWRKDKSLDKPSSIDPLNNTQDPAVPPPKEYNFILPDDPTNADNEPKHQEETSTPTPGVNYDKLPYNSENFTIPLNPLDPETNTETQSNSIPSPKNQEPASVPTRPPQYDEASNPDKLDPDSKSEQGVTGLPDVDSFIPDPDPSYYDLDFSLDNIPQLNLSLLPHASDSRDNSQRSRDDPSSGIEPADGGDRRDIDVAQDPNETPNIIPQQIIPPVQSDLSGVHQLLPIPSREHNRSKPHNNQIPSEITKQTSGTPDEIPIELLNNNDAYFLPLDRTQSQIPSNPPLDDRLQNGPSPGNHQDIKYITLLQPKPQDAKPLNSDQQTRLNVPLIDLDLYLTNGPSIPGKEQNKLIDINDSQKNGPYFPWKPQNFINNNNNYSPIDAQKVNLNKQIPIPFSPPQNPWISNQLYNNHILHQPGEDSSPFLPSDLSSKLSFDDWFNVQLKRGVLSRQKQPVNIDEVYTLKTLISRTLLDNGIHITSNGILKDSNGKFIDIRHLKLRPILIGNSFNLNEILNTGLKIPNTMPYLKAILVSFDGLPRILGFIPIRITYKPTEIYYNREKLNNHPLYGISTKIYKPPEKLLYDPKAYVRFNNPATTDQPYKESIRKLKNRITNIIWKHLKNSKKAEKLIKILGKLRKNNELQKNRPSDSSPPSPKLEENKPTSKPFANDIYEPELKQVDINDLEQQLKRIILNNFKSKPDKAAKVKHVKKNKVKKTKNKPNKDEKVIQLKDVDFGDDNDELDTKHEKRDSDYYEDIYIEPYIPPTQATYGIYNPLSMNKVTTAVDPLGKGARMIVKNERGSKNKNYLQQYLTSYLDDAEKQRSKLREKYYLRNRMWSDLPYINGGIGIRPYWNRRFEVSPWGKSQENISSEDAPGFRIIGGNPATSSGSPINVRGRFGEFNL